MRGARRPRLCDDAGVVQANRVLDSHEFQPFIAGLDYPMFIITTVHAGERSGCLLGFATQVSIHPPRMLVCLSVRNHTYAVAKDAQLLAVHALGEDQRELSERFGEQTGDEVDKFRQGGWRTGPGGVPILDDCPRVMVGRIAQQVPFGDHVGFVLDPILAERRDGAPGLDFSHVRDMSPGHDA